MENKRNKKELVKILKERKDGTGGNVDAILALIVTAIFFISLSIIIQPAPDNHV